MDKADLSVLKMSVQTDDASLSKARKNLEGFYSSILKTAEKQSQKRADAEKSVKATFLIDELARQESISVNDNELVQAVFYEALNMGAEPKAVLEYYQKQGLLPAIKMAMIEDKLLTHLLNKKKVVK